jgi:hypothetical protein
MWVVVLMGLRLRFRMTSEGSRMTGRTISISGFEIYETG